MFIYDPGYSDANTGNDDWILTGGCSETPPIFCGALASSPFFANEVVAQFQNFVGAGVMFGPFNTPAGKLVPSYDNAQDVDERRYVGSNITIYLATLQGQKAAPSYNCTIEAVVQHASDGPALASSTRVLTLDNSINGLFGNLTINSECSNCTLRITQATNACNGYMLLSGISYPITHAPPPSEECAASQNQDISFSPGGSWVSAPSLNTSASLCAIKQGSINTVLNGAEAEIEFEGGGVVVFGNFTNSLYVVVSYSPSILNSYSY